MINTDKLREEYQALSQQLAQPDVFKDKDRYQQLARRFSQLEKIFDLLKQQEKIQKDKQQFDKVLMDPSEDAEMIALAREEIPLMEAKLEELNDEIENLILEDVADAERDVLIEIRAAAGGEEAALFAADLFKMYSKYAERKGWICETLSSHPTEIGGFKELIFSVRGTSCYSHLKFESGVHRVQRVPVTESGGRIHTSTVTVAVLVEPKNVELKIDLQDLRIDTYRASGAGGQHVNRTDSAVRITHLPTGIVVTCQDERSQLKNRERGMRVLKARLLAIKQERERNKISQERRIQIGTGERSEKIRTYNFPERRVTEHRINLTVYRLEAILEGDLDVIVKSLLKEERIKKYAAKGFN